MEKPEEEKIFLDQKSIKESKKNSNDVEVNQQLLDRLDLLIKVLTIVLVLLGIVAMALFCYFLVMNYTGKSNIDNNDNNRKNETTAGNNEIVSSFSSSSNNDDQIDVVVVDNFNPTASPLYPSDDILPINVTKSRRSPYYRLGSSPGPFIEDVQMFDEELGVSLSNFSLRGKYQTEQLPNSTIDLNERRRFFIRQMTREAWYYHNNERFTANQIIIDSMSTLWVMNLTNEFEDGKRLMMSPGWDLYRVDTDWEVFEVVTEWIGGLLSCYALTGGEVFLRNAKEIAKRMEPAYSGVSGLSYNTYNFLKKTPTGKWQSASKMGGQLVEYKYLDSVTGYDTQLNRRVQGLISKFGSRGALYPFKNAFASLDYNSESGSKEPAKLNKLLGANYFSTVLKHLTVQSNSSGLFSIDNFMFGEEQLSRTQLKYANSRPGYMLYSSCYLGSLLALVSNATESGYNKDYYMTLADNLTETCFQASNRTQTGLPPVRFDFDDEDEATNSKKDYRRAFWLNPELAESYFVLWRLTHNEKYRTYAWALARSIFEHTRSCSSNYVNSVRTTVSCQFLPIQDVNQIPTTKLNNNQQTGRFLSGTLKYLYLTFTDDSVLPLDQWLFNYAGHPLPICGRNPVYPKEVTNCDLY